jgi:signal transduction histidine kinase
LEKAALESEPRPVFFRRVDGAVQSLPTWVKTCRGGGTRAAFAILVTAVAADPAGDERGRRASPSLEFGSVAEEHGESSATVIADRPEADASRLRLLRRLMVAQEDERARIAQHLHDDLGQLLTSLRLTLGGLRSSVETQPGLARLVDSALALLTNIDDGLDFLAWELRPAALEGLGLAKVIEGYVSEWSRHTSVLARFHSRLTEADRFPPAIEATIYRIAQEALNNVAKHSQARTVNVTLEPRHGRLVLAVEDDGIGFAVHEARDRTMGLSGMRERAGAVGGTIEWEPTPGGGTTVLATIPMVDTPLAAPAASSIALIGQDAALVAKVTPTDAVLGALRARLLDLQHAVAARDEFIATVAHELRNPISPLVFQVRLALDKTDQMAAAGEVATIPWVQTQLRRMEQRLHRLLETLDRLLDVSRLSTGRIDLQPESLDFAQIVQEVLTGFEAELAVARCPVSFTTRGETVGCWDRIRLEQICRNLISNAVRFGAGRPLTIEVNGDSNRVTLVVCDHGIGIARSLHSRIFERFERGVERRSGGFGIGLWVAKNICIAMNGEISVESEPGAGACFTVTLPRRIGATSVLQEKL